MKIIALIAIFAFAFAGSQALGQGKSSSDQKAGNCSILVEGNGNTASIKCESIDANLAAQIRELVNASRRDEGTKKDFADKLDQIISMVAQLNRGDRVEASVQKAQPDQTGEPPQVGLGFVYSKEPSVVIYNQSNVVARDIIWEVVLWDVDSHDWNPLQIPTGSINWLRPHDPGGPNMILKPFEAKFTPGTHLLGSAIVSCATCVQGRTYIVDITWGQGGWFSETETVKPGRLIVPADTSADKWSVFFSSLEAVVPVEKRIPITDSAPQ
jgi:hypothetical protein